MAQQEREGVPSFREMEQLQCSNAPKGFLCNGNHCRPRLDCSLGEVFTGEHFSQACTL